MLGPFVYELSLARVTTTASGLATAARLGMTSTIQGRIMPVC